MCPGDIPGGGAVDAGSHPNCLVMGLDAPSAVHEGSLVTVLRSTVLTLLSLLDFWQCEHTVASL